MIDEACMSQILVAKFEALLKKDLYLANCSMSRDMFTNLVTIAKVHKKLTPCSKRGVYQ